MVDIPEESVQTGLREDLLTGQELEGALSISRTTLWKYRKMGMPFKGGKRTIRYDLKEVLAWMKENQ